jgi:ATP-dependent Clp protease ATP-binding subunit ClpC
VHIRRVFDQIKRTISAAERATALVRESTASDLCHPDEMFERFEDPARRVVVLAQEEARSLRHAYVAAQHVLLALCRVGEEGDAVLRRAMPGVTVADARARLVDITPEGTQEPLGHLPFVEDGKAVLEGSLREATRLGHERIGTGHLLLAVLSVDADTPRRLVAELRIDADRARSAVAESAEAANGSEGEADPGVSDRLTLLEEQVRTLTDQVAELRRGLGEN